MASTVNKAIIVGRLGKDPELRFTASGQAVCSFTVATDEWAGGSGENRETRTEWHRIVTWGKTAERCNEYLRKGRLVYLEGRIQTRSWEKEGVKRYTTEIVAQIVNFLGGSSDREGFEGGGSGGGGGRPQQQQSQRPAQQSEPDMPEGEDDFPF